MITLGKLFRLMVRSQGTETAQGCSWVCCLRKWAAQRRVCSHSRCWCVAPFVASYVVQEIVGLGLANFAGSAFNAYSTTGSFSRSAVNFDSGVSLCDWLAEQAVE